MKKLILLIGLFSCIFTAQAQQGSFELSANGQMQLKGGKHFITESSELKNKFKKGIGGSLEGAYYLSDGISLGLELGYNSLKKYTASGIEYKPKTIFALVKPRFYLTTSSRVRPYAELGAGLTRMTLDAKKTGEVGSAPEAKDLKSTKFMVAPGLGVRIGLSDKVDINLGARYNFLKDYRHIQAMAGIAFRLN